MTDVNCMVLNFSHQTAFLSHENIHFFYYFFDNFNVPLFVFAYFQENIIEEKLTIPHKLHNAIIGAKGRLIRSIMEECGGVNIKFPPGGSNSDIVVLRGPKEDVEKAKKELLQQAKEKVIFLR